MQWWRDHSLTIVLSCIGLGFIFIAMPLEEGSWFDLWLGLGHGALTAALLFFLSKWFRERNKPED